MINDASSHVSCSYVSDSDDYSAFHTDEVTKCSLLSDIAIFYDPLGWLNILTIQAKLLVQQAMDSNFNLESA